MGEGQEIRFLVSGSGLFGIVPKAEAPTLKTVAWEIEMQVIESKQWLDKVAGGKVLIMDFGDAGGAGGDSDWDSGSVNVDFGPIPATRSTAPTTGGNVSDCKTDIALGAGIGGTLGAESGGLIGAGLGLLIGGAVAASNSTSCKPKKG